jgi:putative ubiquitin-RnfH superfamily antitoxin RatB of RatAB toxin-antitoxin module
MSPRKRCCVAYATSEKQHLWVVELALEATIAEALQAAQRLADPEARLVPWDSAAVGIFGEMRDRSDCPRDGDRIEIYRPLQLDPRTRRRQRVQQVRKSR